MKINLLRAFTAVLQYAVLFSRRERVDILESDKSPAGRGWGPDFGH